MKTAVKLQAGPLEATFEDGGLRAITCCGVEVVRAIYAAVRDRDWGTVAHKLEVKQLQQMDDEAIVQFQCHHARGDIDFAWNGSIRMTPDSIRFDFSGTARTSFLKNRIGFCVLHPMAFAGLPLEVLAEEGGTVGVFPDAISPHQPFKDIRKMVYEPVPGCRVHMSFAGDLFEMEDQRNWTDASYKTYCTPLALPYPVQMQAGERIAQSVLIEIRKPEQSASGFASHDPVQITVQQEPLCRLPDIGFVLAAEGGGPENTELITRLGPSHLYETLDLARCDWETRLDAAIQAAARIGCGLELEVLLEATELPTAEPIKLAELDKLVERLASNQLGQAETRMPDISLLPYMARSVVTDEAALRMMRRSLRERGLTLPVGGGTRAYYAEFNRAALPLSDMDFAAYSMNPQVHAFDDKSLMETLAAQRVTAQDAAAKSGKPLSIGPITFKPRLNPNATSGDGSISLAEQIDSRQGKMFGAAWTLGSLAALSLPEVRRLTYFATSGPLGLAPEGMPIPLHDVLKDVLEAPNALVHAVHCASDRVIALALRFPEGKLRLMIANATDQDLAVAIDVGASCDSCFVKEYAVQAAHESAAELAIPMAVSLRDVSGCRLNRTLPPYGCIRIDCLG